MHQGVVIISRARSQISYRLLDHRGKVGGEVGFTREHPGRGLSQLIGIGAVLEPSIGLVIHITFQIGADGRGSLRNIRRGIGVQRRCGQIGTVADSDKTSNLPGDRTVLVLGDQAVVVGGE